MVCELFEGEGQWDFTASRKVTVLIHLLSSPLSLPRGPLPRRGPTDLHPEACGPSQHLRPSPSSQHTGWTPQATPAAASALPSLRPQEPPEPLCFKPAGQERDFQQISSIPDSGLGQILKPLELGRQGARRPPTSSATSPGVCGHQVSGQSLRDK